MLLGLGSLLVAMRPPIVVGGPAPVITSLDHEIAPPAGGTTVNVTGTDFVAGCTCEIMAGASVAGTGVVTFNDSTSLSVVMPAVSSGLYTFRITNPDDQFDEHSNWFEYWSPAQLSLAAWLKGPYAGRPWLPTASAGTSASTGNWTNASDGVAPSVGSAVNGVTPAAFDGVDDSLAAVNSTTDFVTTMAGAVFAVFKRPATPPAAATDFYDDPAIWSESSGNAAFVVTSSGVRVGAYNGGSKQTASIACSSGWHTGAMRWDGTDVRCRLDTTDATPVAVAGAVSFAGTMILGLNYSGAKFFAGEILDFIAASALDDATLDKLRLYYRAIYPAAALP